MAKKSEASVSCSVCNGSIRLDDDFCAHCGALFAENTFCSIHNSHSANAVCIICNKPFCADCGMWVQQKFLCGAHRTYEIYEGMARVYGVSDEAMARLASERLQQAGVHSFVYARKASPISLGGPDYSLFRASGEYDGHIINEFKVMVPCQEVLRAEHVLHELEMA
jgi:hypothetical protein